MHVAAAKLVLHPGEADSSILHGRSHRKEDCVWMRRFLRFGSCSFSERRVAAGEHPAGAGADADACVKNGVCSTGEEQWLLSARTE